MESDLQIKTSNIGTIAHKRNIPVEHKFQYPFFMWFLNLDELEQLPSVGRWFSTKGWAMSRFNRPDYYGDPEVPLADAIRSRMEELTGEVVTGQVCGLLNMRTLGVYFSPINFYYGYDDKGDFSHFLAEVVIFESQTSFARKTRPDQCHPC